MSETELDMLFVVVKMEITLTLYLAATKNTQTMFV